MVLPNCILTIPRIQMVILGRVSMASFLEAVFTTWELRPVVVLVLVGLGDSCMLGWWRLRRRGHRELAAGWRLSLYLAGLGVLAVALLSGLDHLQQELFAAHMVQHELLMMVAAPLILLANPFPFFLWALPDRARSGVGRLFVPDGSGRRLLRPLTSPRAAWVLYVGSLWLWHSPAAYDAALGHGLLHDVEHVSFFATALLFWWHVIGAAPRIHRTMNRWRRAGYVVGALAQNEILGVSIAFAGSPLYAHYTTVSHSWSMSVLQEQMVAGAIMWIPGGMMYAVALVLLIVSTLDDQYAAAYRAGRQPTAGPRTIAGG